MLLAASLGLTVVGISATTSAMAAGIAGLAPYQRPEGAPTVDKIERNEAWNERALRGVQNPVPESLRWLQDQGAWYTPFTRPGMPGYYDIRGWHTSSAPQKETASK